MGSKVITAAPPPINPKLVVPFVNAVRQVFATMAKVQTAVDRPRLKTDRGASYDVSSIIGFSGDLAGSVVLSFPMETAVKLVKEFTGTAVAPGSPDFADAVGELANMIAGGAKTQLGSLASISVPNVIIGSGHVIARLSDVPCIVIPCKTPVGNFAVEVNIKQVSPKK